MTFTVEDGTGLADANSLCTVEVADAYFTERGIAAWTGSTPNKQMALVRGTDYLEARWGLRFKGVRQFDAQALSFPRLYIGNDSLVPAAVQRAVAEYGVRALTKTLDPDPTTDARAMPVKRLRERIEGAIDTEVEYATPAASAPSFPQADRLVAPFLVRSGGVVR